MFIAPTGLEQALAVTKLKTFIQNERFERSIRHTKNPCGEILLREKLDVHILEREVLRWVGEPGIMRQEAYQLIHSETHGRSTNDVNVGPSS